MGSVARGVVFLMINYIVPLVFERGRPPSVVVWSCSMGWARLGAQGDLGVLSE